MLSSELSKANPMVMIGVVEQRAPLRCLFSDDGTVQEKHFANRRRQL